MLTRLRTRNAQEDAVQCVLSNPDLVALILERLPIPRLRFGTDSGLSGNRDRWAASQVSAAFRRAALRLPWEAQWGPHYETEPHYNSDSTPSLEALATLGARNLQIWTMCVVESGKYESMLDPNAAAVLNYARGTEKLALHTGLSHHVLKWLYHTLVPLPKGAQGSLAQGTPVLACLASLSRLTSLRVCSIFEPWGYASRLRSISQLKCVHLQGYAGPPLAGLPALESLCLEGRATQVTLEQWASPRLTALSLRKCSTETSGDASGLEGRVWLGRIQRLELVDVGLYIHDRGLREVVPGLTYLKLCWGARDERTMSLLCSNGLPVGLKGLHIQAPRIDWSVLAGLHDLALLEVQQEEEFIAGQAATVVAGLARLPNLKEVDLHLPVYYGAGVRQSFRPLEAQLLSQRGYLHLSLGPLSPRPPPHSSALGPSSSSSNDYD